MNVTAAEETRLLKHCLEGDRASFEPLVKRYQSLICSIAYGACGNLSISEDIAQETFVTAWLNLKNLRDLGKFKSWLCGIARNLSHQSFRNQGRNPVASATSLETIAESASTVPSPAEAVITAEEASLVWQYLEQIPEIYREPIILFYREEQSINQVAEALDLKPDTVKQRLSRGRKMLREEVIHLVESSLANSRPKRAFTAGVIAALPSIAPGLATAGAAGVTKGTLAAKAVATGSGFGGFWLAPVMQLFLAAVGVKMQLDETTSARERRLVIRLLLAGLGLLALYIVLVIFAPGAIGLEHWPQSRVPPAALMLVFFVVWLPLCIWASKRIKQIRAQEGNSVEAQPVAGTGPDQLSTSGVARRFAAGILATTAWLAAVAVQSGEWMAFASITTISLVAFAIGTWFCLRRPETYFKSMGLSTTLAALGAILVTGFITGLWSGHPAKPSDWLLPAIQLTTTSVVIVNLLAWKRDAKIRRRGETSVQ